MRVLVTRDIHPDGLSILLRAGHEVDLITGDASLSDVALRFRVRGCDAVLSMVTDPVDADFMDAASLRVIAQHGAGIDNIDLDAARKRGIVVTHTPGALTDATADFTMALMLAVTRRVLEGHRLVQDGRFYGWDPHLLCGLELRGARLGIIGRGRVGTAVQQRAEAFGMEVVHHGRSDGLALPELLATSDVVSVHCPLTADTHHLLNATTLGTMKRGAYLVNTARGPIVDEDALVRALREQQLAGAALDVFEREPMVHEDLLQMPNVVVAPHLGSATTAARRRMAVSAARDLVAVLAGEAPQHRVV